MSLELCRTIIYGSWGFPPACAFSSATDHPIYTPEWGKNPLRGKVEEMYIFYICRALMNKNMGIEYSRQIRVGALV